MSMTFEERMEHFLFQKPQVDPTAYIAPSANIIGNVTIGEEASIWYQTVLRGDINKIVIGPRSNIQDGCVVHMEDNSPTLVGEYVTVGHKAILHACTIEDEVLIGMGAIILDGAEIGARSIIGAGAIVTKGKKIPPGSLVIGAPGRVVRSLDLEEQKSLRVGAEKYVKVSRQHMRLL